MAIELRVVQFWSEIILVISNCTALSSITIINYNFEICKCITLILHKYRPCFITPNTTRSDSLSQSHCIYLLATWYPWPTQQKSQHADELPHSVPLLNRYHPVSVGINLRKVYEIFWLPPIPLSSDGEVAAVHIWDSIWLTP